MEGGYFGYNGIQIPGNRMKLYFRLYEGPYWGAGGANNGQFYAIKQHRDNMSSHTNSSWPTGMKKLNQEVGETKLKFYFHYLL